LKKEGDYIVPGDAIADIETDKASMAFEAQDEFYIAKILVAAGLEVKVGDPIFVSVDDASFVANFANYTSPSVSAEAITPPVQQVKAESVKEKIVKVDAPVPATLPEKVPAAVSNPSTAPAPVHAPKQIKQISGKIWGSSIPNGPLAAKLSLDQTLYLKNFGRTGQKPITVKISSKSAK